MQTRNHSRFEAQLGTPINDGRANLPVYPIHRRQAFMSYWFAVIPVALWLMWLIYHILKAPYEIYLGLHKELQIEIEKNRPKFKLSCRKDIHGCAIESPGGVEKFFRLQVKTDCVNGIEGCIGHLIKIEKDGLIVYDHDAVELPFARANEADCLSKSIFPNNPYFLDVLVTHNPTHTVFFATKGHFPAHDQKREYIFKSSGEFILTVGVSGKGVPTVKTKLKFDWKGQWSTATIEQIDDKSDTITLDRLQ